MRPIRLLFLADQLINFLRRTRLYCGAYRGHHPHFPGRTGNQKDKADLSRYHLRILSMPPGNLHFASRYEHPVDGLFQSGWTGLADHHPPPSKLLALDVAYFRLIFFLTKFPPVPRQTQGASLYLKNCHKRSSCSFCCWLASPNEAEKKKSLQDEITSPS